MSDLFDFDTEIRPVEWSIDGFVPKGHLVMVFGQAGKGKSLFVNHLITCLLCETPFLSRFPVRGGDVLFVDRDSPVGTVTRRLQKYRNFLGMPVLYNLHKRFQDTPDVPLASSSLRTLLSTVESDYIVLDSMHSLCGNLDPNSARDMTKGLSTLKEWANGRTCFVVHHVGEKTPLSVNELMTCMTSNLPMGSSAIVQQTDTCIFITSGSNGDGALDKIFVRVVPKREAIPLSPFEAKVVFNGNDSEGMLFERFYTTGLTDCQSDIIKLLETVSDPLSIKETRDRMGSLYSEWDIRKAYKDLLMGSKVSLLREGHNLFKYGLQGDDCESC